MFDSHFYVDHHTFIQILCVVTITLQINCTLTLVQEKAGNLRSADGV